MSTWAEFAEQAPQIAEHGRAVWQRSGLMFLGTVRRDGSPRVHPVVPILAGGCLGVAIAEWSPKWKDLARDPRCVLHGLPGTGDDEFVLRATTKPALDRARFVAAAKHELHDSDHIVEFDLVQADLGYWENVGQPGTFAVRWRWTPGAVVQLKP